MKFRTMAVAVMALLLVTSIPPLDANAADGAVPLEQPSHPISLEDVVRDELRTNADIINGIPVASEAHPYVALLVFVDPITGDPTSTCTGSLVDSTHIMTAAHCVEDLHPAVVALNLNSLDDMENAELLLADEVILAPDAWWVDENDIALLRLNTPAATSPVTLATEGDDYQFTGGTPATIVGWGARDSSGTATDHLLQGDMELLNPDACYAAFGDVYDNAGMLCAGGLTADACFGDSGGPLLIWDDEWVVMGVTSFGDIGCKTGDASAFARVSQAQEWLGRHVSDLAVREGWGPFSDVRRDERHFEAILAITDRGITEGMLNRDFGPNLVVTRAQMASFIARALGLSSGGASRFRDVPSSNEHAGAIAAVAGAGITTGYADGTFRPGEHITRDQMATFLTRAFRLASPPRSLFTDVPDDSVHARSVSAVAEAGITIGFSDGTFRPRRKVTRGEMASFIARALGLVVMTPSR